jgi:hypothetical protein
MGREIQESDHQAREERLKKLTDMGSPRALAEYLLSLEERVARLERDRGS